MKKSKNNTDNDLVTKKYLDEKLEISQNNLKKYVDEKFVKNTSKIIGYVDMKFQTVDERFEKIDKKLEMLDSMSKTLDWLAKQYKDLRDEHTFQFEQYRRIEDRVTALEKRVFAS